MVPLAVVTEKIENLHEGLDLERGWLIHKTWGTVFLILRTVHVFEPADPSSGRTCETNVSK